jgi:hypothetical protein
MIDLKEYIIPNILGPNIEPSLPQALANPTPVPLTSVGKFSGT